MAYTSTWKEEKEREKERRRGKLPAIIEE